jgi:type I restriction enzyme M protein
MAADYLYSPGLHRFEHSCVTSAPPQATAAENVFWVAEGGALVAPASQREATNHRQADRRGNGEIEKANPGLKGVLPKDYNRPALDKLMLGELIDLVSGIGWQEY